MIQSNAIPGLFSVPRLTTLSGALLVALGSGTNYVYSAYAPQMGSRLHLTHTQLNLIGLSGNAGMYFSGPVVGKFVDSRGPKMLLAVATNLLLFGYLGMKLLYDKGLGSSQDALPTISIILLVICGFMTGCGGCAGFAAAVNATAKTFPDSARATTTGIVISGFGLSAFCFSFISHYAFPGDTSTFFLVLALGSAVPHALGFFVIRPIALHHPDYEVLDDSNEPLTNNSSSNLLDSSSSLCHQSDSSTPAQEYIPDAVADVELERPLSRHRLHNTHQNLHRYLSQQSKYEGISGLRVVCTLEFWLLFIILILLSGTGLMYINNVGLMAQALYMHENPSGEESEKWQAAQVSTVSVMSFSGRIIIGLLSDMLKSRFRVPRSMSSALVSAVFLISQIMAVNTTLVENLWKTSSMLGLGYGAMFSLFPNICIEWFGIGHFSENWGYISIGPVIGSNIFSLAFGRNLDQHSAECLDGLPCYVDTLQLTKGACGLALALSCYAGWRDWKERRRDI